jgi:hypothetical protein
MLEIFVLIFNVAGAVQHMVEQTCLLSATVWATRLIYGNITASKYKYASPMVSPLHDRSNLTMRAWQEKAASLNQRPRWCLRCRLHSGTKVMTSFGPSPGARVQNWGPARQYGLASGEQQANTNRKLPRHTYWT